MRYAVDATQGKRVEKFIHRTPYNSDLVRMGFDVASGFLCLRVTGSDVTLPRIEIIKGTKVDLEGDATLQPGGEFIILGKGGRATFSQLKPPLEFSCKIDSSE